MSLSNAAAKTSNVQQNMSLSSCLTLNFGKDTTQTQKEKLQTQKCPYTCQPLDVRPRKHPNSLNLAYIPEILSTNCHAPYLVSLQCFKVSLGLFLFLPASMMLPTEGTTSQFSSIFELTVTACAVETKATRPQARK